MKYQGYFTKSCDGKDLNKTLNTCDQSNRFHGSQKVAATKNPAANECMNKMYTHWYISLLYPG